MLTKKQFKSLKVGDVVLFRGNPRTVRNVSWLNTRGGGRGAITFSIRRRSWTGRIFTVYGYNDVKHFISLPRKHRGQSEVCRIEESLLIDNGFNVVREIKRELAEDDRCSRLGFARNRSATALLRKSYRKLKRRIK